MRKAKPLAPIYGLAEFQQLRDDAGLVLEKTREAMLAPTAKKVAPMVSYGQIAEICGTDRSAIKKLINAGKIPEGTPDGKRVVYPMKIAVDVVRTIRQERGELRDPKNTRPITITTCNFKGGVSKTTTTATLAQGLALRGFNVLLIDADPQGSLSSLFGFNTATEVQEKNTLLPIFQPLDPDETDPEVIESSASVVPAIQTTYWENIHMIAANMGLYGAEFSIPSTQARDPQAMFWNILHERLEELREINLHDVIIIDTPPSLSYLTINALMASDGLLMPLPPANLDFASSAQFWALITELLENFKQMRDFEKKLSFIDVLFAKVDHAEQMQSEVREWILNAYRGKVLPIEIPKTATASTASASYGTVYDMEPGAASAKTLKRALDAYERMVDIIEEQMFGVWNWQADQKKD